MKYNLIDAKVTNGFRLYLKFTDGTHGEIDLTDLSGKGVFEAWNDRVEFEKAMVIPGVGLEWPGGIDLCEDALYLRLTGKRPEDIFAGLKGAPVVA